MQQKTDNTSPKEGKLPNLLVIGAMKAGTTSLHAYLDRHPDIFMSEVKEINYFASDHFSRFPREWYTNQFRTDKPIRGESSQNYSKCHNKYYEGIPERIHQVIPDVRMIYIVRDPIERYRSHIQENYYGEPRHDLLYNIKSGSYVKTSMYHMQIQAFLKYFSLDQFLFVEFEQLVKNRLETMNRIFEWLNLPLINDPAVFDFQMNESAQKVLPQWVRDTYVYRGLHKLLPASTMQKIERNKALKKWIFRKGEKIILEENDLKRLQDELKEDIDQFRTLTGLSFEHWQI